MMPVGGMFWAVSNAQPDDLLVWLEPWAEEFRVPSGSSVLFEIDSDAERTEVPELEVTDDHIVYWANGGELIRVSIDGIFQNSASAQVVSPEFPNLSPKEFLSLALPTHSTARLGGRPPAASPDEPIWRKLTD